MPPGRSPIALLAAPYDSGRHRERMGAGPPALSGAGAGDRLRARGHAVQERELTVSAPWRAELATAFDLHRLIAAATVEARAAGQVPLLMSGNCNANLGVLAGLTPSVPRLGLVWFDAHGDFNTPQTDAGGFLDGQAVAMATGRCWTAATAAVPGFRPLSDDRVMLVGTRSLDEAEAHALHDSDITVLAPGPARDGGAVTAAATALAGRVDAVHVHVDLDVHDPSIAPANGYAAPDGLFPGDVHAVVRQIGERTRIASASLAAWDPGYDVGNRMRDVALDLLELLAGAASP